ncbi:MAG: ABC transporter substrate-binding protein [Candidatus Heteroscillospira sp.]|jgi:peptide/nickel transport system substrate-binding protein
MPSKIKKLGCLVLSAALALGMSGCRGSVEQPEQEVQGSTIGEEIEDIAAADNIFSLNSDQSGTFHPYTDTSVLNRLFMPLVFESMMELDGNFNVSYGLITKAETSDGIIWTFYVDTTAKFQDGSALTARDVAYSLNRAKLGNEYAGRLANMYGVTAMDDEMLLVSLNKADMQFPSLLNLPVVKSGSGEDIAPVGTGPYMYNEDHTELRLWSGHPKAAEMPIDTIYLKSYTGPESTISAFEDSLIDLVENDPTGLSDLGYGSANEKRYCNTTNLHYLGFNQNSAFFCYPKFRYFVTFAVDREQIVTDSMGGAAVGSTLPISPLSSLYNQNFANNFVYSPERAAASLKNAGAEDLDADGMLEFMMGSVVVDIKLDFIVCGDSAAKVSAARDIAENLRELGLEVNLRELNWSDYQEALEEGEFDMYYAEVKLSADFNLTQLLTEDGNLNFGKISDPGYETYIDDYLASGDDTRQMNCELMCKYLQDTAPIVPILFEKTEVLTHRGVVTGASPTQYNVFQNFENWTINLD